MLFNCAKCGVVENTALCDRGSDKQIERFVGSKGDANSYWCSECHLGEWHGEFKKSYERISPMCGSY